MKAKKHEENDMATESQEVQMEQSMQEMDRLIGELAELRQRIRPKQQRNRSRDIPRVSPMEEVLLPTHLRVAKRK